MTLTFNKFNQAGTVEDQEEEEYSTHNTKELMSISFIILKHL